MGGSGRGGYFKHEPPANIKEALRREEQITESQTFDANVAQAIGGLLADYNDRDPDAVNSAIDEVRRALEAEIEDGSVAPLFGGSVRKHTYVNGISDVDCLFVLKSEDLAKLSPDEVLNYFEARIHDKFPKARVSRDNMAITLDRKGVTLQMLPAVKGQGRSVLIPSESGRGWSKIHPEAFFRKLSEVNSQNGMKVVPTVKIAKGVNDGFPERYRLSGYHIESLAIEAFKGYKGPQNTKAMVEHFFATAAGRVLTPIRDKTGQSVHVDEYAGAKNSEIRRAMSQHLDRVARRMKNADATRSLEKWVHIIDPEGP